MTPLAHSKMTSLYFQYQYKIRQICTHSGQTENEVSLPQGAAVCKHAALQQLFQQADLLQLPTEGNQERY